MSRVKRGGGRAFSVGGYNVWEMQGPRFWSLPGQAAVVFSRNTHCLDLKVDFEPGPSSLGGVSQLPRVREGTEEIKGLSNSNIMQWLESALAPVSFAFALTPPPALLCPALGGRDPGGGW